MNTTSEPVRAGRGHAVWVRLTHWWVAASVLTLAVTGFLILMVHPRLYWGPVGNDLTPPLLELPISRNHHHGGWQSPVAFFPGSGSAVTATRTYDIFNQNGWARSLHFLAAWILVVSGGVYLMRGVFSGHIRRNVLPTKSERSPRAVWHDLLAHLGGASARGGVGPPYNVLQKYAYSGVAFLAVPVMIWTGLAMSPAVSASYPWLAGVLGGSQSARTVHFFCFTLIVLFVTAHLAMVVSTGFRRQLRGMTWGNPS